MGWEIVGTTKTTVIADRTITRTVTKGNLLVFSQFAGNAAASHTITGDSLHGNASIANTWSKTPRGTINGSANCRMTIWTAIARKTGPMTLTYTQDDGPVHIIELGYTASGGVKGFGGGRPLILEAGVIDGARTLATDGETSGSVTTTKDGCIVFGIMFCTNTVPSTKYWDHGTGYADVTGAYTDGDSATYTWHVEFVVQLDKGAINPTFTAFFNGGGDFYDGWTLTIAPPVSGVAGPRKANKDFALDGEDEGNFGDMLDVRNWWRSPSGLLVPA